jgi:hypothetical protein
MRETSSSNNMPRKGVLLALEKAFRTSITRQTGTRWCIRLRALSILR